MALTTRPPGPWQGRTTSTSHSRAAATARAPGRGRRRRVQRRGAGSRSVGSDDPTLATSPCLRLSSVAAAATWLVAPLPTHGAAARGRWRTGRVVLSRGRVPAGGPPLHSCGETRLHRSRSCGAVTGGCWPAGAARSRWPLWRSSTHLRVPELTVLEDVGRASSRLASASVTVRSSRRLHSRSSAHAGSVAVWSAAAPVPVPSAVTVIALGPSAGRSGRDVGDRRAARTAPSAARRSRAARPRRTPVARRSTAGRPASAQVWDARARQAS